MIAYDSRSNMTRTSDFFINVLLNAILNSLASDRVLQASSCLSLHTIEPRLSGLLLSESPD